MPINDDDKQFELYLKRFRPLAPDALPSERPRHSGSRRTLMQAACAVAAVVALAAFAATVFPRITQTRSSHVAEQSEEHTRNAEPLLYTPPLTIGTANALLSTAPSFETALDEIAVPSQRIPLPKGKHSALAVLGKEETKL